MLVTKKFKIMPYGELVDVVADFDINLIRPTMQFTLPPSIAVEIPRFVFEDGDLHLWVRETYKNLFPNDKMPYLQAQLESMVHKVENL